MEFGGGPSQTIHPANSGPHTAEYYLDNVGDFGDMYYLTCSALGDVSCLSVVPSSKWLYSGTGTIITVTYSVGQDGGTLKVKADGSPPAETISSPIVTGTVKLRNTPRDNWERSSCLVAGAGESAVVCGEIVTSHGLPGYTTLGKERSLALVYSGAPAAPRPSVAVVVTRSSLEPIPTSLNVDLRVNTGSGFVSKVTSAPAPWTTSPLSRQVVMYYGAAGDPTGAYPYHLLVTKTYSGGSSTDTVSGLLAVVNRSQSEFGQGWAVAGVEQLVFGQPVSTGHGGILWVAAEGSARMYWPGVQLTSGMLTASNVGGWSAVNAVDGNTGTNAWQTDGAGPGAWVRADLGSSKPVTTVRVHATAGQQAEYDVQYSDGGVVWRTAYQGFKLVPGWTTASWPYAGAHRYWRLKLTNTPGAGGWVTELSFGSPTVFQGAPGSRPDSLIKYDSASTTFYRRTLAHGVTVLFNSAGRHIRTANRVGQVTTFTYDGSNRLTTVAVPPVGTGGSYVLTYDGAGKVATIIDPASRVLTATVTSGRLVTLKDPDLVNTTFEYDGLGRMTKRVNRRGIGNVFVYANNFRVTQVKVPYGATGADTAFTNFEPWDEKGRPGTAPVDTGLSYTKILGPRVNVADDAIFWVDQWGAPTKIQDPVGAVTQLVRGDARHPALVTKVIHPNGRISTMAYDGRGRLTEVRDSTWHLAASIRLPTKATKYVYNDATTPDSPTRIENVYLQGSTYAYNSLGLTASVLDPRGLSTTFAYQASGSLKGVLLSVTENQVETWRESDSTIQTLAHVSSFTYDTKGNLLTSKSPSSAVTSYARDGYGRATDVYDPLKGRQTYGYDVLNRTTQTLQYTGTYSHPTVPNPLAGCDVSYFVCADSTHLHNPPGSSLTTHYGLAVGTLDTIIDPRGVMRRYEYDARGAVLKERDEFASAKTAVYDAGGLLTSMTSRDGHLIKHFYNVAGRRIAMVFPARGSQHSGDATVVPGDSIVYEYDQLGNLTRAVNSEGEIRRTYYADGSLRSKATSFPADSIHYNYDGVGAVTMAVYRGIDTVTYGYLTASEDLNTITARFKTNGTTHQRTFTFTWDKMGRRKQVVYPENNQTVHYAYDQLGTLRRVQATNSASPVGTNRLEFTFRNRLVDPVGHVLRHTSSCDGTINYSGHHLQQIPCASTGADLDVNNRYNRLGMLVSQSTHLSAKDSMRYDASGNMILKKVVPSVGSVKVQDFGMLSGSNRLSWDSTSSDAFRINFTFTPSGSRKLEDPNDGYPGAYPLKRWYYYDALGRMTGTRYYKWTGSNWDLHYNATACRYDADGNMSSPCDDVAPRQTFDGANVTFTTDNWRFIHGPGTDDPLIGVHRASDNAVYRTIYFVTDGAGRQFAVGKADGTLTSDEIPGSGTYAGSGWRYAGATQGSHGFGADRMSNPNVGGVSYFRNRAYDARTGRWTQEDPIGVAGGLNLYQYNGNNPVAHSDPFGLCPPKDNDPCNLMTGDPHLDDPTVRQGLEDAYKGAAANATYPGYVNEVAGYCSPPVCTSHPGGLTSASPGIRMGGDVLEYHTHGNSNMQDPRQSNPNIIFDDNPSPADVRNARDPSRAGLSSYIVTPNSLHKLTPDGKGGTTQECFQRWYTSNAGCQP